jgi:hypothetical protein
MILDGNRQSKNIDDFLGPFTQCLLITELGKWGYICGYRVNEAAEWGVAV